MIDQPLTVLHVVATLDHGGTEVTCRDLITEFNKRPNVKNVVAALTRGTGSIEPELMSGSEPPITLLGNRRFLRFFRFYRLCRRLKPRAVIFHFFHLDHVVLSAAARLAGVASIVSQAGNPAPDPSAAPSRKWWLIILLSKVVRCRIVSASAYIQSSLRRLSNLPPGSCVVHNGCDCDKIYSRAQKTKSSKTRPIYTVGMISRLDPIKDHDCLLEAFAMVVRLNPQTAVRLRIVGDGPLRDVLKAKAAALGIAEKVEFLGNRSDIAEQLGEFDLFTLSTSREEGFGIVLIEALAAGVPLIASDVPACREVLRNGEFGQLVKPHDPEALANAIAAYLLKPMPNGQSPVPNPAAVKEAYGLETMAGKHWGVVMHEQAQ